MSTQQVLRDTLDMASHRLSMLGVIHRAVSTEDKIHPFAVTLPDLIERPLLKAAQDERDKRAGRDVSVRGNIKKVLSVSTTICVRTRHLEVRECQILKLTQPDMRFSSPVADSRSVSGDGRQAHDQAPQAAITSPELLNEPPSQILHL